MPRHIKFVNNRGDKSKIVINKQPSSPIQFKKLNIIKSIKDLTIPLNACIKQSNMNKLQKFAKENNLLVS
ncbi:MAG: hypothetical protein LBP70_01600 [Mycoplasmataceae bacterium]|jgi:hypothetical protein|nr:hypothetical protein [Mycoplasmataceae bacterium]